MNDKHITCLDISFEGIISYSAIFKKIQRMINSLSLTEHGEFIILVTKNQYDILYRGQPTMVSGASLIISPSSSKRTYTSTYMGIPILLGIEDIYRCSECLKQTENIIMICEKHYKTIVALDKLRK